MTRIGILSVPGALFVDINVNMHLICVLSVVFSVNCSDKEYCLGTK